MKYLLLDTSTDVMVLLLHINNQLVDSIYRQGKSDHQAHIVPLIDELLSKNNLKINDIDKVIIGNGPGSYTGLRVGLMTAKMIAFAGNIELRSISSLAFLTSGYEDKLFAWHDARNNDGFSGSFIKAELIGEEKLRNQSVLTEEEKNTLLVIQKDAIKINTTNIINNSVKVEDIFAVVPNYLRKTEAEAKLDKESGS